MLLEKKSEWILSKLEVLYKFSNLLENSNFNLEEDTRWNGVEALSTKDIWFNHYVSSSLKPKSFLNPFNSKGKSGEDFVWEIKRNSIQNSDWFREEKWSCL